MTDKDLNKIGDLIETKLGGIKESLEDHTKRLNALSRDTEKVLSEVKGIHDEIGLWHQRDKREIDEIKKHLDLPLIADSL